MQTFARDCREWHAGNWRDEIRRVIAHSYVAGQRPEGSAPVQGHVRGFRLPRSHGSLRVYPPGRGYTEVANVLRSAHVGTKQISFLVLPGPLPYTRRREYAPEFA